MTSVVCALSKYALIIFAARKANRVQLIIPRSLGSTAVIIVAIWTLPSSITRSYARQLSSTRATSVLMRPWRDRPDGSRRLKALMRSDS